MIVMGGIHATILSDEALKYADVVIAGEGEELWPLFIHDYLYGDINPIYKSNMPGGYDLKKALMPRYELLEGYEYPVITLYTTRGCPHNCSFCCASNIFGTRYRRKGNTRILEELNRINSLFPDRLFLFVYEPAIIAGFGKAFVGAIDEPL